MAPKSPSKEKSVTARDVVKSKIDAFKTAAPPPSKKQEVLADLQGGVSRADFMSLTLAQAEEVIKALREQTDVAALEIAKEDITLAELFRKSPESKSADKATKQALVEAVATYISENGESDDFDASPDAIAKATGVPFKVVKGVLKKLSRNAA